MRRLDRISIVRPRLAVFEGKGQPFPFLGTRPAPMATLSAEQYIAVFYVLQVWRGVYESHACNVNLTRDPSIPCWSKWSGAAWVEHQANQFRADMFRRLGHIHISLMLHLALPPGWHLHPLTEAETDTMARYGHWSDETTWHSPAVIKGSSVWVER